MPVAFCIAETPAHPRLTEYLKSAGYDEMRFGSVRKALSALKKTRPDLVIADFIYAYATNYDSNHMSNLDSLLIMLRRKSSHQPVFVFLADKSEARHVATVAEHYAGFCSRYHVLTYPVSAAGLDEALNS